MRIVALGKQMHGLRRFGPFFLGFLFVTALGFYRTSHGRVQNESVHHGGESHVSEHIPLPNSRAAGGDTPVSLLSKSMAMLAQGKYELVGDVEAVWQLPPDGTPRKGVLFIAHGCNHGAIDWWPQSASCPTCIGLPEEMNVTLHSLLRGYAVIAVSSVARSGSRCWQSAFGGQDFSDYPDHSDVDRVERVLGTLIPREGLSSLPLFALGASSGGAFVLGLPLRMPGAFKALAVQIMAGPPGLVARYRSAPDVPPWPPTIFIHMPRDPYLGPMVEGNVRDMRQQGVRTAEIQIHPQPLTPLYLAQRCAPEVDEQTSRAIYQALKSVDYLDERGYLTHNPRERGAGGWRAVLRQAGVPGLQDKLRLQPDASPIAEELNLLWAGHELTSETTTDMIDWFEAGLAAGGAPGGGGGSGGGQTDSATS